MPLGGTGSIATDYQLAGPPYWPIWGYSGDLYMGDGGPPGGPNAHCNQGYTYAGSINESSCGGYGTWGLTDLEVWYLAKGA